MVTNNKPIWQMTGEEFLSMLDGRIDDKITTAINNLDFTKEDHVYGIKGLAKLLGCSRTHAQTIKSSGDLDDAIFQDGRTIVINKQKALELFKKRGK